LNSSVHSLSATLNLWEKQGQASDDDDDDRMVGDDAKPSLEAAK